MKNSSSCALLVATPSLSMDLGAQCRIAPATSDPVAYRSLPPRQAFPIDNGFIDRSGKLLHRPVILVEETGQQPLLPFVSEDKSSCGFKDKAGAEKVKPQFRGMRPFKDHMSVVQDLKGNWGFVNSTER